MQQGEVGSPSQQKIDEYDVLGAPPSPDLQALADLTAELLGAPMAAINLLTDTEQHMVATSGIDPSVCAREDSMCAVVAAEPGPVVVPDARVDDRFSANPFVTGVLDRFRFYASAALVSTDGVPVGRLCVFDHEPRELDERQREALVVLAGRVMDVLELRLRSRQLEASLAELTAVRDELARSNQELSRFAQQVSHDLRTPLTGILANAELLAAEPVLSSDDDLRVVVDDILFSGRRMNDLIGQVLAYGQEGGRLSVHPTPLRNVFHRARVDIGRLLEERDGEVELADLPTVPCDPDLLYSVALNLLGNAVKFARPGVPPRVCVSTESYADSSGDRVRVRVSDNGVGVPADRVDEVFGLFVRGASEAEGHGIGLATAKRIVEAHGGRIGIERSDGPGTTVWFELPA